MGYSRHLKLWERTLRFVYWLSSWRCAAMLWSPIWWRALCQPGLCNNSWICEPHPLTFISCSAQWKELLCTEAFSFQTAASCVPKSSSWQN